jgi:uracil-DNA glycosylase
LTVRAGEPASHSKIGRQIFTDEVIKILSEEKNNLVFLLWGNYAISKKSLIDNDKHLILTGVHPSPLSASRGWFGCNHFRLANEYLSNQ